METRVRGARPAAWPEAGAYATSGHRATAATRVQAGRAPPFDGRGRGHECPAMLKIRALVILNPVAPRSDPERLREILAETFPEGTYRVFETPAEGAEAAVRDAVCEAAADGCEVVIAAGGDGTVSLVAACLADVAAAGGVAPPLAIVPLGTANVLAHELRVPMALEGAIALAAERPQVDTLDAIRVGERRFLTQVGAGLDARMIEDAARGAHQRLGRFGYLLSLVRGARHEHSRRFTLVLDGRPMRLRATGIVVANAATVGAAPLTWGPGIDPSDGVLDVYAWDVRRFTDYFTLLWRAVTGRHRTDARTRFYRFRRTLEIRANQAVKVQGDGEMIGETPIEVHVEARALRVVRPPIEDDPDADIVPGPGDTPEEAAAEPPTARPWHHWRSLAHQARRFAALDAILFLHANRMRRQAVLDGLMVALSRPMDHGEGWVAIAIAAALVKPGGAWRAVGLVAALWLTMLAVNYPLKAAFRRKRPFITHVETRVIGRRPSDTSFPSGHTAAAFAGALLLAPVFPALTPLFYGYAVLVGFSRVYLGVHYPSDVVIGGAIGTVLAATFWAAVQWFLPRTG